MRNIYLTRFFILTFIILSVICNVNAQNIVGEWTIHEEWINDDSPYKEKMAVDYILNFSADGRFENYSISSSNLDIDTNNKTENMKPFLNRLNFKGKYKYDATNRRLTLNCEDGDNLYITVSKLSDSYLSIKYDDGSEVTTMKRTSASPKLKFW